MINFLAAITWFFPKKEYLARFADNESAKKAATRLWNAIDSGDIILVIVMLLLTLAICWWYFFPFNNKSGRHYHPKYWVLWGLVALIIVFAASYFVCNMIAKNPGFDVGFLFKVSALNTFYAFVVYLFVSWTINRTGKSNAYPFI